MHAIQSTNFQSVSSDASELNKVLDDHIGNGVKCNEFFQLSRSYQSKDLFSAHFKYAFVFSKMFTSISNNSCQEWKEKYQTICQNITLTNSVEEKETIDNELDGLKVKIELAEKTNEVFCQKLISLIQNNAEILLKNDGVFFLGDIGRFQGGIGECHCCDLMGREMRNYFSRELIGEIATFFPEKKSLSIASIGAGVAFHELEIHTLAHQKGYPVSEWTLVDETFDLKMVKNFETIAKWATPNTTVVALHQLSTEFFASLQNSNSPPDVFLFIDMDMHISESQIQSYAQKLNHRGLFASFSKRKEGANFYESKNKQAI